MKALALVLVVAVLSAPALAPAQTPDWETHSFDNGRFWRRMDADQKVFWMHGYEDGLKAGSIMARQSEAQSALAWSLSLPRHLTNSETIAALDHFYSETPENAPVPISDALIVVALKAGGASATDVEKATADFRRASTVR